MVTVLPKPLSSNMKIELPKNWKLLAGLPLSEEIDRSLMRKIEDTILQGDDKTLDQLEKIIKVRRDQLKKHINDLQPGAFNK